MLLARVNERFIPRGTGRTGLRLIRWNAGRQLRPHSLIPGVSSGTATRASLPGFNAYRLTVPPKIPVARLGRRDESDESRSMRKPLSPASIGLWSAGRPWLAIALWLAFVVLAVGVLAFTGSKSLQSGVTGEAGRAESMLTQHRARPTQRAFAYLHSDAVVVGDAAFHSAIARVQARVESALGGHVTIRVSAGGHSALVSGTVARPFSTDALRASVAAAGGPRITSVLDDNSGGSGSNDLARAERLSLPVTLLVLLIAFGALVAAVVPVVLGATAVIAAFGLWGRSARCSRSTRA